MNSISILISSHGRGEALRECLESLARADLSGVSEILLLVNGPDSSARELAGEFQPRLPVLEVIESSATLSRGAARNRLAAKSSGEWLYFLDDDVVVPPALFRKTLELIPLHPRRRLVGLGGPNLTRPGAGFFERVSGRLHESPLVAWRMSGRYRRAPQGWASDAQLILCNLCVARAALDGAGHSFDESLVSAEENLLVWGLRRQGGEFLYHPDLFVYHRRRQGPWPLARQIFRCGAGRGQVLRLSPRTFSPVHVLPSLFALYAALLPLAMLLPRPWPLRLALPLAAYAAAAAVEALRIGIREKSAAAALVALALIPLAHLSYGLGVLSGEFVRRPRESAAFAKSATTLA